MAIGAADDPLEREADQVAEQVMRMEAPGEKPLETSRLNQPVVSRSTDGAVLAGEAPTSVHAALASPGQPLAPYERAFFEPRFGMDFSQVRVHTDGLAQQSARDVHALAYTVESHMVFDAGQYRPDTINGKHLLAHELAHVLQQGANARHTPSLILREGADWSRRALEVDTGAVPYMCPEPERQIDDGIVQGHIDNSLANARLPEGGIDIGQAFAGLRSLREINCCEVNLAAAEHYMYARQQVALGETSYWGMMALILGYELLKISPLLFIPRTGNCPITRFSTTYILWARQGALAGQRDYQSQQQQSRIFTG
ncbi:MAG: DUF4157 domain-containing protein [Cyanobium sp.]